MSSRLLAGAVIGLFVVVLAISAVALLGGDDADDPGADDVATAEPDDADSDALGDASTEPPGAGSDGADETGPAETGPAGARPDPAEARPEPEPVPALLVAHLEAALAADDVRAVENLSVLVTDDRGEEIVALRPDLPVTPASTTKLVTAAAALRLLGPDYRYVTRVHATAEPVDGVLDGDIVLVGSGDPALASPIYMKELYPARPHTPIDDLAAAVADAGVTEVRGSVRGDPRIFDHEPVAEGWRERYFSSLNTANASGLTVDAGRRLFERDDTLLAEAADDPAVRTAEVLTELLDERGVEIAGEPSDGRLPPEARELGRVRSPPLRDLLRHVVQASDNHMADGIFRTIGALTEKGTWEASDAAVREVLSGAAIDIDDAVLSDGSGLSRDNRLSARMLLDIDHTMTEEQAEEWRPLLAVAGESGTLRRRMAGTAADGRVAGKTGALSDARALAAQVDSLDDRRYYFAVVGGELDGPGIQAVRRLMDEIALLLASEPPACSPEQTDDEGRCP